MCRFQLVDEDTLCLDDSQFSLRVHYGIGARIFMDLFHNLVDNYSFRISKAVFEVDVPYENHRKKGEIRAIREYIDFVIYSNLLEQRGIEISSLVRQSLCGNDYLVIRHASALAILAYIYSKQGYSIEFFHPDGPDFAVNGTKSDLKVQVPTVLKEPPRRKRRTWEVRNELMLDLSRRLQSRLIEGIRQAECVFFEMSEQVWGTAFLSNRLNRIVEPKKERVIFYETRFFLHDHEVFWHDDKGDESMGRPVYPDLYTFSGCYIDFDRFLWDFFSGR